jgi:glycosyltransferase involved in cell wall biosynthesis
MTGRDHPIVFVDANTIWHRRLAAALGEIAAPTIAFTPYRSWLPGRQMETIDNSGTRFVSVGLLPGWASKTAAVGQRHLSWRVGNLIERCRGEAVVILTSPKYTRLARRLRDRVRLVYYCADDYRSYAGWGGDSIAAAEAEMVEACMLSVFASEALRNRAIADYGVHPKNTLVSPNATEPRFLSTGPVAVPAGIEALPRPVVGVLGAVTERLDLPVLKAVAEREEVDTLLIAGSVAESARVAAPWIHSHAKIRVTGRIPHEEMHLYARSMDAGLIPYARTVLNHYCSPLRLYDHLAAGTPVFATDCCDQINRLDEPRVTVAGRESLADAIGSHFSASLHEPGSPVAPTPNPRRELLWSDRAKRLRQSMDRHFSTGKAIDLTVIPGTAP